MPAALHLQHPVNAYSRELTVNGYDNLLPEITVNYFLVDLSGINYYVFNDKITS